MNPEVFRFITIRPPQRAAGPRGNAIAFVVSDGPDSLASRIRPHREPSSRRTLLEIVQAHVRSEDFLDSESKFDRRLLDFHASLIGTGDRHFDAAARSAFHASFDTDPGSFASDSSFRKLCERVGNSILAAVVDSSVSSQTRGLLSMAAAACAIIDALAGGRRVSSADIRFPVIVFPTGLFPLPSAGADLSDHRREESRRRLREADSDRMRTRKLSEEMAAHRRAIEELIATVTGRSSVPRAERTRENPGATLTSSEVSGLSHETRSILHAAGLGERVDVTRGIAAIEKELRSLASTIHSNGGSARMVRIGNEVIPADRLSGLHVRGGGGLTKPTIHFPGACPPPQPAPSVEETATPTVPLGHGEARVLGIADLMVVEQVLARYELGEIAHIENVLESEKRERKFKTSKATEESLLIETEQREETEKNLISSERFELQAETQNVINESASKDAGLTINASYGPSVDATATANYASTSAKQRSDSTSSAFARETTSRAVNRLQKRSLERRFFRTVQKVEESNLHSFDNSKGTDNISGIYRHVDKIYTAQVVNYGKRLMLEFVVPEPAAFWRYAISKQPLVNVPYVNPEPPGYCLEDGKTFIDLQAQDLNAENYVQWASKYGAEDVEPPPAKTVTASASKKSPDPMQALREGGPKAASDVFDVDIPAG